MEAHAHLRRVFADRVGDVGANLQIARILRRLAVDQARARGRHDGLSGLRGRGQQVAHRRRVGVQPHDVVDFGGQRVAAQGFEVGEKVAGQGHVGLGLLVVARDDRVVRALEQAQLAVVRQLDAAGRVQLRLAAVEPGHRRDHGGGDVVFHLHLFGGNEILAQLEGAPLLVGIEAHAQVAGDDAAAEHLQFVAGRAVHHVDRELLVPVIAPFRAVEALDQEHQRQDARRDAVEPGVVGVGVAGRRRQELDHRTEAAFHGERLARGVAVLVLESGAEAVGVIVPEDAAHPFQVAVEVVDEQRAVDDRVLERLGNFRLAAAGDRARLVAERAFGLDPDKAPGRRARVLAHLHLVAVGLHVDLARHEADLAGPAFLFPGDALRVEVETHVLRNVDDVGIVDVERVALRHQPHALAVARQQIRERIARLARPAVDAVFLAVIAALEQQGAAGMLLLGQAVKVGGKADLGLDLFLAVAEVVVGQNGDHHAAGIARGELERLAVVVALVGILPAHALAALALGRVIPVRQAQFAFGQRDQMRGEHHAAGVPAPVFHVECGVVFRQIGIAAVAEDALDEIQVADQVAGRKETDFHAFLRRHAGNRRADHRAQQQRDEHARGFGLVDGIGQRQQFDGRIEGVLEHAREHFARHRLLVAGNRQAAFADMKQAPGGAPIARRIVQHALAHPVAGNDFRAEHVRVGRQRQLARQPLVVEDEALSRQMRHLVHPGQVAFEEVLDAPVGWAQIARKQPVLGAIGHQQVVRHVHEAVTFLPMHERLAG